MEDIVKGPDANVMRGLQKGIDAANREAVSNAQKIQKWMILPRDFSKMYQKQIEKIYA